ncbi:hypothetical protein D3C87_891650 [compost metagenome]
MCQRQILDNQYETFYVPVGVNLRDAVIHNRYYHICNECGTKEHIYKWANYINDIRVKINILIEDNPFKF